MRPVVVISVLIGSFLGLAAAKAQTTVQPGQLATAALPSRVAVSPTSLAPVKSPKQVAPSVEDSRGRKANRIWIAGLVAVAAANSLDSASSWGKLEGNSWMASSDGTFGAKGVAIKTGLTAALIVPQALLLRHRSNLKTKAAVGDFLEAAVLTGVSIHNFGVKEPK